MTDGIAQRLEKTDLPGAAELERLCFSEPWSENALALLTDGIQAVGACVREDGRAVAYGGMMIAPGEGQITNIAVHPDYRRRGAGAAILERLIAEAGERNLGQIVLEVRESNEGAIRLYRRKGFETVGIRKNFYRKPTEDALIMVRTLGNGIKEE